MKVKDIIIYPIKSMGGIHLKESLCEEKGLQYDRRMMLVDSEGIFITQREFPQLALIGASLETGGFRFYHKNAESEELFVSNEMSLGDHRNVKVWNHAFEAAEVEGVSEWFSNHIKKKVSLVKMTTSSIRHKSLIKAPSKTLLSMADGYPYLFISEKSLEDLNSRLSDAVPMNRFRPNIVISDVDAYGEEKVDKIASDHVNFRMIKPCARCSMITIDQKTTKKLVEPLKTLSSYKKKGNKVYFGMNGVCTSEGIIRVGDKLSEI